MRHNKACKLRHSSLGCFANQSANMPTGDRLAVPLTFKQFFSAILLRISPIQNLVPRTAFALRDVGCGFLLGNDALQVQFADSLKQRHP